MSYQHILIAADLHPNADQAVIDRACEIAKQNKAKITIIHVVEHLSAAYGIGMAQAYPAVLNIETELMNEAKVELQKIVAKHQLDSAEIVIEAGSPKNIIIETAKQRQCDLILLGSHGRHGLSLLLGSTANAVLHHAPCDVLAVRLQN